ncbi:hypothetical protein ACNR9Q_11275 [Maribacter sp. X9]|uniref:hypothetical protein n=1 Tax=Maribacter sp. X9 TaxID=3402159 RepID=UPI003AF337CD
MQLKVTYKIASIYLGIKNRKVFLPNEEWRYFFEDSVLINGTGTLKGEFLLDEFTVYIKEGLIVSPDIKRGYTLLVDSSSDVYFTLLLFLDHENSFGYYHTKTSQETEVSYIEKKKELLIKFIRDKIPHILRIHPSKNPNKVLHDSKLLAPIKWNHNLSRQNIIIWSNLEKV